MVLNWVLERGMESTPLGPVHLGGIISTPISIKAKIELMPDKRINVLQVFFFLYINIGRWFMEEGILS